MHGAGDEKGVVGEGILVRNLVEHVACAGELACLGVESDELGGEEVVGGGGGEDEAGVELLRLAREAAVGAALDEAAVESEVDGVAIWAG